MTKNIALYPGSFDPFHEGHLRVLIKAQPLFDHIYIVLSNNINKQPRLSWQNRLTKIQQAISKYDNVSVIENARPILTVDIAHQYQAKYLIRGLRNNIDIEYELNLSHLNYDLDRNINTIFFVSDYTTHKISSSLIAELHKLKSLK